jgi:hypothetical protein
MIIGQIGYCYELSLLVNTNILMTKVWKNFCYAFGFTDFMGKNSGKL